MNHLVSVIIPTYNRPEMLKEALTSVLSQTYKDFEILVINDGGIDVKSVIDSLNTDGNIVYLRHEKNKGLPAARNTGIKAAAGKYLAYLDDDDVYYPNHIEMLAGFLEKTAFKAAYTDSYHVVQSLVKNKYVTESKQVLYSNDFDGKRLLVSNLFPVINVMHRKDILEEVGLFDELLNAHEDWELWIRISRYHDFHHIKTITAEVRVRTDGSNMTARSLMTHLTTMQIIHKRYAHLVTDDHMLGEQGKAEDALTREVEQQISVTKEMSVKQRTEIARLKEMADKQSIEIARLKGLADKQSIEIARLKEIADKLRAETYPLRELADKQRIGIARLKEITDKLRTEISRLKEIENSLTWKTLRRILNIVDGSFGRKSINQSPIIIDTAEKFEDIEFEIPEEEIIATPAIYFYCDRAEMLFDTLEVSGWAIASHGIEKVEIFCNDELLGNAKYGNPRPDVMAAYPFIENSYGSGFSFCGKFEKVPAHQSFPLIIRATDRTGQSAELEHVIDLIDRDDNYLIKTIPREGTLRWMRKICENFSIKPHVTLYIGIEDNPSSLLPGTLDSILNQSYPYWDVTLICKNKLPEDILQDLAPLIKENKVKLYQSAGADESIKTIKGDFLGFINAGDLLAPHALFEIVKNINMHPTLELLYTDEDGLINGERKDFFFKPDWSPDLLLSMNYIGQFFLIKKDLFKNAGGLKDYFSCESFYDLLLRAAEHTQDIGHIPFILYTKGAPIEYSASEGKTVLEETLARRGFRGAVIPLDFPGAYRIKREIAGNPMVSIIIPTACKNPEMLRRCLHAIAEISTYKNYEIILIDNSHGKLVLEEIMQGISQPLEIRTILYENEFNFSGMNNIAAAKAEGEYLIFLNDDTEAITPDWIEGMLEHAQRPDVGVTGVKLLYPDGTIQHAGMFLVDYGGGARHAFRHIAENANVYHNFLNITRNCSAVTFACVMVSKKVFSRLGGFDENLKVECNDVDFCLRAIREGYLIVWTPFSVLYHKELATREKFDFVDDTTYFRQRWRYLLEKGDPYYNPNLTLDSDNFLLNIRPVFVEHHEPYLSPDIKTNFAKISDIDPETIRKILVVKLDHIGDVILSLPAIKILRSKFPEARITMLIGSWAKPVVESISEIDDILIFNFFDAISEKGERGLEYEEREILKNTLHSQHFDLAVDLRRHPETREILKMTGARYTVGYSTKENDDRLSISLRTTPEIDDIYAQPYKEHILAQFCHLIDAIPSSASHLVEFPAISMPVFSFKNKIDVNKEHSYLFDYEFVVGIHPFVGSSIRQWPIEYWTCLIDLLIERNNAGIILFGGKGDEKAAAEICLQTVHKEMVTSLAGKLSLEAFMQLVGYCHLFIGNISGPCHIAAAMQVPTLSIFGGAVLAHEWNPIGQHTMSIRLGMPCSPCYRAKPEQCPYNLRCLTSLWPEKVLEAAHQLMIISGTPLKGGKYNGGDMLVKCER